MRNVLGGLESGMEIHNFTLDSSNSGGSDSRMLKFRNNVTLSLVETSSLQSLEGARIP